MTDITDFTNKIVDNLKFNEMIENLTNERAGFPYIIAYANRNVGDGHKGETDYTVFKSMPDNIGVRLTDRRFEKITALYGIKASNDAFPLFVASTFCDQLSNLLEMISEIIYFCKSHNIPIFIGIVVSSDPDQTNYKFDCVTPNALNLKLYDDKIAHALRYTLADNIYPDAYSVLSDIQTLDAESFD